MPSAVTIKQRLHKYIAQHPGCSVAQAVESVPASHITRAKTALLILRNEGKISLKNGTLTNTAAQPV